MDDLWGASLESSVTSCGGDRGQEGKELTKKCLENTCRVNNFVVCIYIFFKPVCSRKSFAEHAGLFSASPLRIHALALSLTWQLPRTSTFLCWALYHCALAALLKGTLPASVEGRPIHFYVPILSKLVGEIQNYSLLVKVIPSPPPLYE